MTLTEKIFIGLNAFALLAWIPLFIAPKRALSHPIYKHRIVPTLLGVCYLVCLIWIMTDPAAPPVDFSFQGIKALFANDKGILVGWVHYLAFDLLIGTFIAEALAQRNTPSWIVLLCLLLTFMFGPLGWLAFGALGRKAD